MAAEAAAAGGGGAASAGLVSLAIAEAVAQLKNLGTYSANVGEYAAKSLQVLPPILGPEGTAYIAKYVAARPLTYWGKTQDDYCRKTGCEIGIASLGIGFSTYNKEAAGASLAQSYFNLTTQQQYLGRPERDGWLVKAAVYEVFGNKTRAAEAAAKAAQLGGSVVTAAQTVAQAKANAEKIALDAVGRVGEESDVIINMARNLRNADGTYAGSGLMVPLPGLTAADLPRFNVGWTEELRKLRNTYDGAVWRSYAYEAKKRRLREGGYQDMALVESMYATGEVARNRQKGDEELQSKLAELERLKAEERQSSTSLAVAKVGWSLWHYIAAGLVTIVVIGGVIYVVRK